MKKIKYLPLLLLTSFILAACNPFAPKNQTGVQNNQNPELDSQPNAQVAKNDNTQMMDVDKGMDDNQMMKYDEEVSNHQKYLDYSPSAIAEATKNGGKALLFFHAQWCPTCQSAEKNILENIDSLPNNLTIIKVDYDSEKELKQKYSVTYQHTFVQVDSSGNEITQWNGGASDQVLSRVK